MTVVVRVRRTDLTSVSSDESACMLCAEQSPDDLIKGYDSVRGRERERMHGKCLD